MSPLLVDPQVLPPEFGRAVEGPVRDDHHGVPPDGTQELPDRVEGPRQLIAEPVTMLEHDYEEVDLLEVREEPDEVLEVPEAGVEARRVDDRDGRGLGSVEPGSAGVGAPQGPRLTTGSGEFL